MSRQNFTPLSKHRSRNAAIQAKNRLLRRTPQWHKSTTIYDDKPSAPARLPLHALYVVRSVQSDGQEVYLVRLKT